MLRIRKWLMYASVLAILLLNSAALAQSQAAETVAEVPAGVDLGVLLLGLMAVIGVGIVMISQARSPKVSA
jgi:anaerobic C4-dicarboxylate transporter